MKVIAFVLAVLTLTIGFSEAYWADRTAKLEARVTFLEKELSSSQVGTRTIYDGAMVALSEGGLEIKDDGVITLGGMSFRPQIVDYNISSDTSVWQVTSPYSINVGKSMQWILYGIKIKDQDYEDAGNVIHKLLQDNSNDFILVNHVHQCIGDGGPDSVYVGDIWLHPKTGEVPNQYDESQGKFIQQILINKGLASPDFAPWKYVEFRAEAGPVQNIEANIGVVTEE